MKNTEVHCIGDYVYFMANDKVRHGKIYDYVGDEDGSEYSIEVKIKCDGEYSVRNHHIETQLCFASLKELFNYLKTTKNMLLNE